MHFLAELWVDLKKEGCWPELLGGCLGDEKVQNGYQRPALEDLVAPK